MRAGAVVGKRKIGVGHVTSKKTYKELYDEFYKRAEILGRAKETLTSYYYHSKYFLKFVGGDIDCKDINADLLLDYIQYNKEVKGIENTATINSYLHNISPIIKYGIKKGYIQNDFTIPFVEEQDKIKDIYTVEELGLLLEKPKKRDFVSVRTWAMVWTFASTGIRAKELTELLISNVDLINRSLVVNTTKNNKARVIPISEALREVLEEYLLIRGGEQSDVMFANVYGEKLARSTMQKHIKNYCDDRGVAKTSIHLHRHTFITNAVNCNVSPMMLKRITGHSNFAMLNKYYNARHSDLVEVIDSITPKSSKKESLFKKKKRR